MTDQIKPNLDDFLKAENLAESYLSIQREFGIRDGDLQHTTEMFDTALSMHDIELGYRFFATLDQEITAMAQEAYEAQDVLPFLRSMSDWILKWQAFFVDTIPQIIENAEDIGFDINATKDRIQNFNKTTN